MIPYGIVYLLTNTVSKKVYVGQTTKSLMARWGQHVRAAKTHSPAPVHRAIRKHQAVAFKVEILEQCPDQNILNQAEARWIAFYQSDRLISGYNCTSGGDVAYTFTTDAKKRISVTQRRRLADPCVRQAMSDLSRAQWQDPSFRKLKSEQASTQWATPSMRRILSDKQRAYFAAHPEAKNTLSNYNKSPAGREAKSKSRKAFFKANPQVCDTFREVQLARQRKLHGASKPDLVLAAIEAGAVTLDISMATGLPVRSVREVLGRYQRRGLIRSRALFPNERPEIEGNARNRTRVWFKESE
jgi:group I intron endonuclease